MAKFFSQDFFSQFQEALDTDSRWEENAKGLKMSLRLTSTGAGSSSSFMVRVEDGKTTIASTEPAAQAEFAFEGSYETWAKIAKGEVDIQSAVLKGALKFKGSITKILLYKDKLARLAEVMRSVPVEF